MLAVGNTGSHCDEGRQDMTAQAASSTKYVCGGVMYAHRTCGWHWTLPPPTSSKQQQQQQQRQQQVPRVVLAAASCLAASTRREASCAWTAWRAGMRSSNKMAGMRSNSLAPGRTPAVRTLSWAGPSAGPGPGPSPLLSVGQVAWASSSSSSGGAWARLSRTLVCQTGGVPPSPHNGRCC
jgi:hypothetical protein